MSVRFCSSVGPISALLPLPCVRQVAFAVALWQLNFSTVQQSYLTLPTAWKAIVRPESIPKACNSR
jgi:hypothetical protein